LEITASGTFYIVGENATGCKDTSTVIVTIHAKPEFEFAAPSAVCGQYDLSELEVNSGDTLGLTLKYYDDIYQELPNTVVSATGTYYVIGTNAGNCSDTSAVTVTIHTKPEFSFANPTAVCSPATVNLLELELNQGGDTIGLELTYYDDIYQELANTTVTLSGTYYIIGVSAENCSDTSAVVVIIHAKPEFTFASPAAVCGQYDLSELALTSGDTAGLELKYYNASDVELPNTTVAVSGTYYVVGTNAGNCTDTSTVTITINAKPEFEFESSVSVCDPATVDLSELELNNGDTIGLNFTYYDNNDLSVSEIVTVSGTYYIVGTNAAGCSDTSTVVVAINEKPEFDFESPEPVCGSFDLAELVLDNGDTVGLTLTYYDEDDLELSDLEVSISGTYYVIGETAAGCSNISTVYITVSEKPEFDFESPEATCGSFDLAELVLDNGDTTDLELKYYDENDQELSSTIVTVSGTYYVVGENEDGCHNLSTVYVTINEKPEFEFASPEEVCYPATIDLSELVLDNGDTIGLELKYFDEDYQELSNLIIAESGTYYIIGTDAGGCADTSTILVSILRPVVENILEDITLESGEATTAITFTGASAFEWEATGDAAAMGLPTGVQTGNFGAYTIQNTTSSNLTATVTVTPIIGTCEGESKSFEITVLPQVGLISLEGTNITLNVFPNPAKQGEIVHITLEDNSVNAQRISNVTIYNIEGKEVSNTYYSDTKVELNTMYLTSGTYLLKISTENGKIINKKIVVQ
jgi:hypothetical protein